MSMSDNVNESPKANKNDVGNNAPGANRSKWAVVKKTAVGLGIGAAVVGLGYGVSRLIGGTASTVNESVESLFR